MTWRVSRRQPPRDGGAATIYATAVGLVLVLAGFGVAVRASDLIAAAEAGVAADLGALAGAAHAAGGPGVACARAARLANLNAAEVVSCRVEGLDLTLTVRVHQAVATSRAGPVRSG